MLSSTCTRTPNIPLIEVGEAALAVHRLVQAVTRDRLPAGERTRWAAVAVKRVAAVFSGSSSPLEPQAWPACARYLPHAVAVVSHVGDTDNMTADMAGLLNQMGLYLDARAQFEEARPYYERALAIYEQVLGPQHPDTARSLNNLGYLLQAQGDLAAARPYFERALHIFRFRLGPEHPSTQAVQANLEALEADE
jgi:tetratricopeptide (TPR) repeat protein